VVGPTILSEAGDPTILSEVVGPTLLGKVGDSTFLGEAELKVPVYAETDVDFEVPGSVTVAEKKWVPSMAPLLAPNLVTGWSKHSERATLPSLYAALGVPKTERDLLGRWAPSGSNDKCSNLPCACP
jgi:hypothetical protein